MKSINLMSFFGALLSLLSGPFASTALGGFMPPPAGFQFTPTTSSGLLLGSVELDGVPASAEDWIAAFDSEGNCAGAAQINIFNGTAFAQLVIYGDDATTEALDEGINGNEEFSLIFFDYSSGVYLSYESGSSESSFSDWQNTNGAPIPGWSDPYQTLVFSSTDYTPLCLDESACNFDAASLGSVNCFYPDDGYDCFGSCLEDSDDDGICDALEIEGCLNPLACNYNQFATESATCEFPSAGFDCTGNCLNDTDSDGVCDEFELLGCTDGGACNFNPNATEENGGCVFPVPEYDCSGVCISDIDGDGICDAFEIPGCSDTAACNYTPQATDDLECLYFDALGNCGGDCENDDDGDGICDSEDICVGQIDDCGVCNGPGAIFDCGCFDIEPNACDCEGNVLDALGYCGGPCAADLDADGVCDTEDDCIGIVDACGVCNGPGAIYDCGCEPILAGQCDCNGNSLDAIGICGGNCSADLDDDGVCDEDEIDGCTDLTACNFDTSATDDDGTCTYPQEHYTCSGLCVSDGDNDGVCDELEVPGCTAEDAMNFNPSASDDDGSCIVPTPPPPSFQVMPNPASGTMFGTATLDGEPLEVYDWIGAFDIDGNCAGAAPVLVFENISYINLTIYGDDPTTAELDEGIANGEDFFLVLWDESEQSLIYYLGGGINSGFNQWVNTNGAPIPGLSDENEVFEFSSSFYEPNCNDPAACNYDATAMIDTGCQFAVWGYDCEGNCLADLDGDGICNPFEIPGCMDINACNYNPSATDNDGTCLLPQVGYDCDGQCSSDADADGVCDEFEISGCTNPDACNFNPSATNPAVCLFAESGYDCEGECIEDADGDGVCDEFEVFGCTNESACNFMPQATENSEDCLFPSFGLDCLGNCLSDINNNDLCDDLEGCTDSMACNFSPLSIYDDGSCEFPEAGYTCEGACESDADADGVCDVFEVAGCTYSFACNFSPLATDDDGSCLFALPGYDCTLNCYFDSDLDGICDQDEVPGCSDPEALNFHPFVTDEDGTCIYESCPSDLDGDGVVNIGDLLSLLSDFETMCEQ